MNEIRVNPQLIELEKRDDIEFRDCLFVSLEIDGIAFTQIEGFEGSLVVLDELEKSVQDSGEFLIFTCACGIADDAGHDGVSVSHRDGVVRWSCNSPNQFDFTFDATEYSSQIRECIQKMGPLLESRKLEPSVVIYPEEWGKS